MTFAYLTTTITFRHGPRPGTRDHSYIQETGKTTAGVPVSQDYRAKIAIIPITWDNMPLADRTALESFFELVGGMAKTWTYIPSIGSAKTVRFAEPEISFVEKSFEVFFFTVRLMEA